MTTYAAALAGHIGRHGFNIAEAIEEFIRNWRARRAIRRLGSYDDYMLRDIGVSREDVRWAASLPLAVNAALALEDRAFRQRHEGRAE